MTFRSSRNLSLLAVLLSLAPASSWACAACYGQADGAMADGMNWGILSLLGVICAVLVGIATFFIVLARRASRSAWSAPLRGAFEPRPSPAGTTALTRRPAAELSTQA